MTPAQDIDADFNHIVAVCLHSWSEREVVAYVQRLQLKVHLHLKSLEHTTQKDHHALHPRPDLHAVRSASAG